MKYRIPDLILIVLLAVGGVFAWQSARERARLSVDYERLVRVAGDLPISDPAKAHFRALETGEPLHFAWRVYVPPDYPMMLRSGSGGFTNITGSQSQDLIARVRFRRNEEGYWEVYQSLAGGSSRSTLGGMPLTDFLAGRMDEILVEQLGAKGVATVEPGGSVVLLRLTPPDDMQADARKALDKYELPRLIPDLFRLEIGPEKPKPAPPPPGG